MIRRTLHTVLAISLLGGVLAAGSTPAGASEVSGVRAVTLPSGGHAIDIAADGRILVSMPGADAVAEVDPTSLSVDATFAVGSIPRGIEVLDDGRVAVALNGAGGVDLLDLEGGSLTRLDLQVELGDPRAWDVIETEPGRLFVSGNPGSSGFAYVVEVSDSDPGTAQRVADERIIRAGPVFAHAPGDEVLYVGTGFSPNSLFGLDLSDPAAPILIEDDHGSVSGTQGLAVAPGGTTIALASGQVLDTDFQQIASLGAGRAVYSADGQTLFRLESCSFGCPEPLAVHAHRVDPANLFVPIASASPACGFSNAITDSIISADGGRIYAVAGNVLCELTIGVELFGPQVEVLSPDPVVVSETTAVHLAGSNFDSVTAVRVDGEAAAFDGNDLAITVEFPVVPDVAGELVIELDSAFGTTPIAVPVVLPLCQGLEATIVGTPGDDVIDGTPGADVIIGLGGDDTIRGLQGNDRLCGNAGADVIIGGSGSDVIDGGLGPDIADGGGQIDFVAGGEGDDELNGGPAGDWISGNEGADVINGEAGGDLLDGGPGTDTIHGHGGDDYILAGTENDVVEGGDGGDIIDGGPGDDWLRGRSGTDTIDGGDGNDDIRGGEDGDVLAGGSGDDLVAGDTGDDQIHGDAGNDDLVGGDGQDRIDGDDGSDEIHGGPGGDGLSGGSGGDVIRGGTGVDWISGDDGADVIYGHGDSDIVNAGAGDDEVWGGGDRDVLLGSEGNDTINAGPGDDYLLGGLGIDALSGGNGFDVCDVGGDAPNLTDSCEA